MLCTALARITLDNLLYSDLYGDICYKIFLSVFSGIRVIPVTGRVVRVAPRIAPRSPENVVSPGMQYLRKTIPGK